MKVSNEELDEYIKGFNKQYSLKKSINAVICFLIFMCGLTGVLYSIFIFHNNIFNRLRYLTFLGTIYTSIISLIFGIISLNEEKNQTEVTNRKAYFLRLSSATTELVIFCVVMVGLSPLVPDNPDITSYPGIMMHLAIPLLTVLSFIFNDPPIGKLKIYEPLNGLAFVFIYAIIMTILFATGELSYKLAPYSFFDFKNTSIGYKLSCTLVIFTFGYLISRFLIFLNSKLSWIWFSHLEQRR